MSSNQRSDDAPYNIEVLNTYPQTVMCTVYMRSSSGGPTPGPMLNLAPNTQQGSGSGDAVFVEVSYPPPSGGTPQNVTIPYGAPIDPNRTLNVLWNTSPTTQVIVIVETGSGED
jgi:hypothetical protein